VDTIEAGPVVKNSVKNKLDNADRRFHDWYRFVLSYPPHLVRHYIEEFQLTSNDLLLDPFCGTGTTLVEAKLNNIPSIGVEANPMVHFASEVKTSWDVNPKRLEETYKIVLKKAAAKLRRQKISDVISEGNGEALNLSRFTEEQEKILLKDSISPLPLHKCLVLRGEISKYANTKYHKYLLLALANSTVFKFSNLKFGPEVGIGKIKKDAEVLSSWESEMVKIIDDLKSKSKEATLTKSKVILGDARNLKSCLRGKRISAVITSPPYPNEKDYSRTTRLESVLLGFVKNKVELQALKRTLVRSNTRSVYKGDTDGQYIQGFTTIQDIANQIEQTRIEMGKTSGFERLYHTVTRLYFGGMAKHLLDLQSILRPNAMLAYVVGDQASYLQVMIRTGNLIAEIAESLGYEVVRIDLFRTRFSTATKSDLNEEVVILRWPGLQI